MDYNRGFKDLLSFVEMETRLWGWHRASSESWGLLRF